MRPLALSEGLIEQIQCGQMSRFILFVFNNPTVIVPFRTVWCWGCVLMGWGRKTPEHHALCSWCLKRLPCVRPVRRLRLSADCLLSFGFCLKAVVVIAAGAEAEETNMGLRFAPSTVWSWRTCPVAAAGRTSRWALTWDFNGLMLLTLLDCGN